MPFDETSQFIIYALSACHFHIFTYAASNHFLIFRMEFDIYTNIFGSLVEYDTKQFENFSVLITQIFEILTISIFVLQDRQMSHCQIQGRSKLVLWPRDSRMNDTATLSPAICPGLARQLKLLSRGTQPVVLHSA
jgi:hypothetical protein